MMSNQLFDADLADPYPRIVRACPGPSTYCCRQEKDLDAFN